MNQCECSTAALTASMEVDLSTCNYFDPAHIGDVEVGVQTQAQIGVWFGKPDHVFQLKGGRERWIYATAHVSWSGAGGSPRALAIDFDSSGRVCDHAYSEIRRAA